MTCYIRHTDNPKEKIQDIEWKAGTELPKIRPIKIVEIQAGDKELEFILKIFNGLISSPHKSSVIWQGALAKIIYRDLLAKRNNDTENLMKEIEAEAIKEGPTAVKELEALRKFFKKQREKV